MLRKVGLIILVLVSWQAQAEYRCNVKPQNDVIISSQWVQVVGANDDLKISPTGNVIRNGNTLTLTDVQRQQALAYQAALRRDLPWFEQGTLQHLEKARVSLDKIIIQQLGSESNVRKRLTTLSSQLKQQIGRIIEKRGDDYIYHHQAINQVEKDGRIIVQQSMGGVLQDSLNEMGIKQASDGASGNNPLQAIIGNLSGLQQSIQNEWNSQEQGFQQFGQEICQRVTALEQQRKDLFNSLK